MICFDVQVKPQCCVGEAADLKMFDDIDYDSFVSLMGRRRAAQQNSESIFQEYLEVETVL